MSFSSIFFIQVNQHDQTANASFASVAPQDTWLQIVEYLKSPSKDFTDFFENLREAGALLASDSQDSGVKFGKPWGTSGLTTYFLVHLLYHTELKTIEVENKAKFIETKKRQTQKEVAMLDPKHGEKYQQALLNTKYHTKKDVRDKL